VTAKQRRPGGNSETAAVSLAADTSVPLALVEYVVRVALDANGHDVDGRRPYFDDMPAHSRLIIDVTACRIPAPEAVTRIYEAMRRGVLVEIVTDSTSGVRAWRGALGRVSW
jgi:hypothetical protein